MKGPLDLLDKIQIRPFFCVERAAAGWFWATCALSGGRREKNCIFDANSVRRRPADIFIPALARCPTALDFVVTAHTRQETLAIARTTPGAAAAAYAQKKQHTLPSRRLASNKVSGSCLWSLNRPGVGMTESCVS